MSHVLIITGGHINISFVSEYIKTLSYDKVFAVDKGLECVHELGIVPDKIIGDFDSVDRNILEVYEHKGSYDRKLPEASYSRNIEVIRHPVKKDASDTELAVKCATCDGADRITILGATGTRIDHMLANLQMLYSVAVTDVECIVVDENNRIRIIDSRRDNDYFVIEGKEQYGKYISLIPITDELTGLTLSGVMYPVSDITVKKGSSLLVSNEITEKTARIHIGSGAALLIESRD